MKTEQETDYYDSQEFYNETMGAYHDEMEKDLKEQNRKNSRITKALLIIKGFPFVQQLMHDMQENSCDGLIEIVKKPKGELQADYWGFTKGVYVDQHTGYECDDYYGHIYFPVKEGKFLKCHFSC